MRRICLIDVGHIAHEHARAIPLFAGNDSAELAVADPVPAARQRFPAAFPGARVVADAAELLAERARPDDIVIIATPPFAHHDLTVAAVRSGRHVLCEKPLAMNVTEAEEMVAAARSVRRVLACCSSRFLGVPTAARVRDLVAAGGLGALIHSMRAGSIGRNGDGPGSTFCRVQPGSSTAVAVVAAC